MANLPRTYHRLRAKVAAYLLAGVGCLFLLLGLWKWGAPAPGRARARDAEPAVEAGGTGLLASDAPLVRSTDPANRELNVRAYQDISITWSQPMNHEATGRAVTIRPAVPFEIRWQEQGRLMIIHPQSPGFQPAPGGALYEITLTTGATSEDGAHLAEDYSFSFFTLACGG